MNTILPESITSVSEAKKYLSDLHHNGEAYHPDDDAHDVLFQTCNPSSVQRDKMNYLMSQVFTFDSLDPYAFLIDLNNSNK